MKTKIQINSKEMKYKFKDLETGECFAVTDENNRIYVKTEEISMVINKPGFQLIDGCVLDDTHPYHSRTNCVSLNDGTFIYVIPSKEVKPIAKIEAYLR